VHAARTLFREHGYARTTINEIAAAAGVAPQTVYWAFGSKAQLVTEIREAWFGEARTGERLGTVLAEPDPAQRLDAYATFMTHQWVTGSEAVAIHQDAMRVDPNVAADVIRMLETRAANLFEVVRPLGEALRPGLTLEVAHDRLLALSTVEMYLELLARGWATEAYRDWLSELLRSQLLRRSRRALHPPPDP
jgi:AcrR family transcriptional regulator